MTTNQNKIAKIKELLGTESGNSWINFMDYISEELSEVLRPGKPSKAAINNSIIGQNGFESWKKMVTTKEKNGGLGWNYSSFEAWKKAYSVVLKNPYLRELELTASQINTFNKETKPNFPNSADEFKALSEKRLDKQKEMHQNSLKDAQNRNTELKNKLTQQDISIERIKSELDSLRLQAAQKDELLEKLETLNQKIGSMQTIIDDRDVKISKLSKSNKAMKIENEKYSNLSLVQKVFLIFK